MAKQKYGVGIGHGKAGSFDSFISGAPEKRTSEAIVRRLAKELDIEFEVLTDNSVYFKNVLLILVGSKSEAVILGDEVRNLIRQLN